MKLTPTRLAVTIALGSMVIAGLLCFRVLAGEARTPSPYEYATIRWDGKDNTHVIRPGGQVEFVGGELRKAPKPDRVDERAFYLNLVMNGLSNEGYEFAGMTQDQIIMRRSRTP